MEHPTLPLDILLLLALSLPVALLFRRFNLPSSVGYLAVGALVGPFALGWIRAEAEVEQLAEIGVALLLFTVGLEFSVPRLLLMKRTLLLGGGGQVLGTIAAVAAVSLALGIEPRQALLVGFLAALSSTALVLKALSDARELESPHGRLSVAVLLFQDLAVIPLMLLVPILAGSGAPGLGGLLWVVGKAVLAVGLVLFVARYGFSRVAGLAMRLGGRELFVLVVVVTALGAALLSQSLDLPLALGAFVAGLVISESEYSHQVVSEILPFRDVFNALFFLSVGMLFDAGELAREPALVLGATLGVVLLKGGVLYGVGAAVSRAPRVSMLFTAALFQVGEFSFVLAHQAVDTGLLPELGYKRFLAVAILTIVASPFVMQLARRRAAVKPAAPGSKGQPGEAGGPEVVIAGFGLNGHHLARVLSATGVRFCVIELNPTTVQGAKRAGVPIVFGDVNRPDALEHAGVPGARVLVVAISDPAATRRAVALARRMAPKIHILARAKYLADTPELIRLGADQVVPEDLETSVEIFGRVLRHLHVPRGTIAVQQELIRREGYQLLRDRLPEDEHLRQVGQILAETAVDTIYVPAGWYAVGRSLVELDLHARTGAWVVSVVRHGEALERPGAAHRVEPGDLLVLLGDHAAIDAARALLEGRVAKREDE